MNEQRQLCKGLKKDGSPCQAQARENGLCFFHDPEEKEKLAAARKKGGKRRRRDKSALAPDVRLESIEDVQGLLGRAIEDAWRLDASERRCRVIGYLAGVVLKAFEVSKLEELQAEIEALKKDRAQEGRQW